MIILGFKMHVLLMKNTDIKLDLKNFGAISLLSCVNGAKSAAK